MAAGSKGISLRCGGREVQMAAAENIAAELALRKAEEAALRRYQAVEWLKRMDRGAQESLPEAPSDEDLRVGLRNGLVLCNVLNIVNPGAVPKVVESPVVTVQSTDGGAQFAIQYFENMRNFLVAVGEMKLLTFDASDLEKGDSMVKVVDCILCLKGYHEWKLAGGIGIWRYGGIVKITSSSKVLASSFCGGGVDADEAYDNSTLLQNQELLKVLHLFIKSFLEESETASSLSYIYDQFALQLLQTFLTDFFGPEDLILNSKLIDTVLDEVVKWLRMLLMSDRNQLAVLLKKSIKDDDISVSRTELIEDVSRYLKEKRFSSYLCPKLSSHGSCPTSSNDERLDNLEKQLEMLKLSFQEMKVQLKCSQRKWQEDLNFFGENLNFFEHHIQGLKANTSSYYKLLEENRVLYNQVQDLKGSIRVYCRVRPFLTPMSDEKSVIDHIGESGNITIINPHKQGKSARNNFMFNKVFGANTKQYEVFADIQALIRSVMDGYNVCIFAYGQTGSGKTYTMSGPDITTEESWGVNYRALNDLFNISSSRTGILTYDVRVQMIEIYNEQVRDLLVAQSSNRSLDIRNNSQLNGLNIPDASQVSVKCTQEVLDVMKIGQGNRAVGATALNERSSRSHSVLTVHVQGKELVSGSILRGCLHLVDLAGSERVDKSKATGERLKEAQHINRSLSALGDVIFALAQKSAHIPYRNSKLTQVLQDALGGQAKTLMFVHINPEVNAFGETISTLKFAERAASIELGAARANRETGELTQLKEEISKLKSALENKESKLMNLKEESYRIPLEVHNPRMTPPLHLQKHSTRASLKREGTQQPTSDPRSYEARSCSSGKQRNPRSHYILLQKKPDSKSPLSSGGSYFNSRKQRSQSPPIRRSVSTDRATVTKSKPKIAEKADERLVLKLRFPEKESSKKSLTTASSVLTDRRLSECCSPKEVANSMQVFLEHEEQLKTPQGVQLNIRKNKAEGMTTYVHREAGEFTQSDMNSRVVDQKNDFPEVENKSNTLVDSSFHGSPGVKKFKLHTARISWDMKIGAFVQPSESLATGEHENNPPIGAYQQKKVGTDRTESAIRRSRSSPRGTFTL